MHSKLRYLLLFLYFTTVLVATSLILYYGSTYYLAPLKERFFHPMHQLLKPTGFWGHGFGIIGSLLMLIGVSLYMIRKRVKRFSKVWVLKYWLELHIFLCTLGPILVLFHTTFKFGGIVSISFWSMVAVVTSGVIGRFIYVQIPRTIQGHTYSIDEIKAEYKEIIASLINKYPSLATQLQKFEHFSDSDAEQDKKTFYTIFFSVTENFRIRKVLSNLKGILGTTDIGAAESAQIIKKVRTALTLQKKTATLRIMQKLFNYWHVAHLPFALIMLVIMIIHVIVSISFGYTWIF